MNFNKAKMITNKMFADTMPINIFHKEMENTSYVPDTKYQNKHILFRKKFDISNKNTTLLSITADDYYKLYINGRFVTQGPAPCYNFEHYYNTIDITEYLHIGSNTIAVHTYYQGLVNRVWVSGDLRHMMMCEIVSDGVIVCYSNEEFKVAEHTAYYECAKINGYETAFIEGYNSNATEIDFANPNFDDSSWEYASIKNNCYYKHVQQPTEQLDIYRIKPKVYNKTDTGYFVDIGQEIVGYITFKANGNKDAMIVIKSGEELQEDGRVRFNMRCNCKYREEFVLNGNADVMYNQYDYKAFRYIDIELPEGTSITDFEVIVRHYPYKAVLNCSVDDAEVKSIWDLCANTIKYGMQEVIMDCPTREKGQYLGDATITGIAHTILTGDDRLMRKTLQNFADSTFISKGMMAVSTSGLMQEIADYSLQFPLQVLWFYNHTKDIEFLRKMQPVVQTLCDEFAYNEQEDGLIERVTDKWNLIDWPENLRDNYDFKLTKPIGEGCINVINAFYYGANVALEKINDILSIPHNPKSEKIKQAYISAFYNENTKLYNDSKTSTHHSIHSNILPLLFSIDCGKDNVDSMVDYLDKRGIETCGVYMAMFYLSALKRNGRDDLVIKHLKSKSAWLKMISEGATTCFEVWGKDDKWNTSLFHPWATAPIVILSDTVFPY